MKKKKDFTGIFLQRKRGGNMSVVPYEKVVPYENSETEQPKPSVLERIQEVLRSEVLPEIREHNGNIEVISVENGVCRVRLTGGCSDCPSAVLEAEDLIREPVLRAVPELSDVILVQETSPELIDFARRILAHKAPEVFG